MNIINKWIKQQQKKNKKKKEKKEEDNNLPRRTPNPHSLFFTSFLGYWTLMATQFHSQLVSKN